MKLPIFSPWPANAPPLQHPCKAIVFIHGIFSSHETFATMRSQLSQNPNLANLRYFYYDYDYHHGLAANGALFAQMLCEIFRPEDDVAVVAHSMGGLVARLAVLSTPMRFLRVSFLLGTPNSGAIRLSQLALLTQMVHGSVGRFFALFPRKSGISDLSRAAQIIKQNLPGVANASNIDYVSIPGLYFHAERKPWEIGGGIAARGFALWDVVLSRLLGVRMRRPHDGIVEEVSNNLITCPAGIWHEKIRSVGPQRGADPATYVHLRLMACSELNHIQIHNDHDVIETVGGIILEKFGLHGPPVASPLPQPAPLENWVNNLTGSQKATIQISFSP